MRVQEEIQESAPSVDWFIIYNLIKFASMLIRFFKINERLDCFNRGYVNNSSFGDENQRSRGFAVPAVTLSAPPIGRWNE